MATLLIVEDDRKTNDAVCEYLRPKGHTAIPAYDGGGGRYSFSNRAALILSCWTLCYD